MTDAISEIISNGILFDVKNWATAMPKKDDFSQAVEALFDTLAERKVTYLLVGGVALLSYVDGRNTQDIDLILDRSDLDMIPEIQINEENKNLIRGKFSELQVDVLLTQNALFKEVIQEFGTDRQFGDRIIRCVTVEGLLLLKCYALPSLYRQAEFSRASIYENDILLLLLKYSINIGAALKVLSNYLIASDLSEVKGILMEIQGRVQRFSAQKQKLEGEEKNLF